MSLASYGALLEHVRGLAWPSRRRAAGTLPGTHRSRLRGSAPELSEYRLYRQGDEPRRIDWRLLARSDRTYIRLAEDRAILGTWFLLDASASMAFPAPPDDKWHCAAAITVALASIALAAGDPVGLIVARAEGALRLPPRARRGALRDVAAMLDAVQPWGAPTLAPLLGDVRRGARIVVVSDFLGDEPELRLAAHAAVLAGGDVHAVHVVAVEELEPPVRALRAVDPEQPALARALHPSRRAEYQLRFAEWRSDLAHAWRRAGAGYSLVATRDDRARAVRRIVRSLPADPVVGDRRP